MKYLRIIVVLLITTSLAVTFTVGAKSVLIKPAVKKLQAQKKPTTNSAAYFNNKVEINKDAPVQLSLNADLWFAFGAILISGSYLLVKNNIIPIHVKFK